MFYTLPFYTLLTLIIISACSNPTLDNGKSDPPSTLKSINIDDYLSFEIPDGSIAVFNGIIGTAGGDFYDGATVENPVAQLFNMFMADNKFRIVKLELKLDNSLGSEIAEELEKDRIRFTVYNSPGFIYEHDIDSISQYANTAAASTAVTYTIQDISDKDYSLETFGTYMILECYVKVMSISSQNFGWRATELKIVNIDEVYQMGIDLNSR